METKDKAREILDYCIYTLLGTYELTEKDCKNPKRVYKEMLKVIKFMMGGD